MYAFRFGGGGGGVVAYHANHHLDSSNQRLLHRTTGDRGVAFQHIEHFGNRMGDWEPCRFQIGSWNAELQIDLQNLL